MAVSTDILNSWTHQESERIRRRLNAMHNGMLSQQLGGARNFEIPKIIHQAAPPKTYREELQAEIDEWLR